MRLKILKPTNGGHDGSSFREILDIWREQDICDVIDNVTPSERHGDNTQWIESRPWCGEVGDILLYDQPILDKINPTLNWKLALFANEVPDNPSGDAFFKHWSDRGYCSSWTFWPNHPRDHEKARTEIPSYDEREFESCFIGTLTTGYRGDFQKWQPVIKNFWMGQGNSRLMSQSEYLGYLKKHRFGLCLRGVGPKCLRDVELIGLGTVPIFTPGVSTDYYNRLEKDKHFLFAESPEELLEVVKNCSRDKWEYMSGECLKWFADNGSPDGVYKVTTKIINDFYVK